MKKIKIVIVLFLFIALALNVFGQTTTYSFEVIKSGIGSKSIIFIPGFACSGAVWRETTTKFEKDYTCYTITMAGFAGVNPQPNASFINWETSIANYIKNNKIEKPILIGHSMGGGLALALASDYPELIGKIVIVDALPCLAALMNPAFKALENNDCSGILKQVTELNDDQFYQMQVKSISRLLADTSMYQTVINWSVTSDRKTFALMYCDFSNTDLRDKIKSIKCPSIILLESYFTNLIKPIEEQYKNLQNANLQYANKGLHFIMYDDKEWFFNQLNIFVTQK